ncbi:MAG TPA: phosphohistidine phosphatase SixA [Bacteroidota bacterium]|nr:phosphohistidine phosphatase SixA [Bacteroidota bacterium]
MELYLLRHGIAVPRGTPGFPNDDRPLTDDGRRKMRRASAGMSKILTDISCILSSPLRRTAETAEIVAEALGMSDKICERAELLPDAPVQGLKDLLIEFRDHRKLLLVGHGPTIGEFASGLIGASGTRIEFRKGGLCRIDIEPEISGSGMLRWHFTPKHLRLLSRITIHEEKSPSRSSSVPRPARRRRGH